MKQIRGLVVLIAMMAVGAIFASSASAECGPGFSSKSQLIRIVKENPEIAHGMRRELLSEPKSDYQADETVLNYLRDPHQKVKITPSGYVLSTNTECPGGYGDYTPTSVLLGNMPGKPMLWHCKELGEGGHNCTPILKGYCMNFVTGPPAFPPKKPPHKEPPHRKPPVRIRKVAKDSSGKKIPTPTGTFRFKVTAHGYSKVVTLNHNPQFVAKFRTGTTVTVKELKPVGKQDWEVVSARKQHIRVGKHGLTFVFVDKEKSPPEEGGICSGNTVVNGDVCGGTCNNTTIIVGNGNNVNNEAICPPPTCEETGTCPPPVKHWTEISCTGFEEISGGGSFLVDCAVSDDNGAPISLDAHSNDGNSRVSGINCYSNGGSQTCPSGGIFEFRVSGINDGSSILYSSITATASANGVSKTFTSDPFPVDPSSGGF